MVRSKPTAALKNLSIAELQALLETKVNQERKPLPALNKKRDALASQLEEIEAEIAAIGGERPTRPRAAKKAPVKRGRKPGRPATKVAKKKVAGTMRVKRGGKITIPFRWSGAPRLDVT